MPALDRPEGKLGKYWAVAEPISGQCYVYQWDRWCTVGSAGSGVSQSVGLPYAVGSFMLMNRVICVGRAMLCQF